MMSAGAAGKALQPSAHAYAGLRGSWCDAGVQVGAGEAPLLHGHTCTAALVVLGAVALVGLLLLAGISLMM